MVVLMNKEVKELIDTLKEYADGFTSVLAPTEESVNVLLDYINQLEEELKYTVPIVEHNKIISEKLKENQQLKERIEYYYEFDEEFKKEDLPEELQPYYKNQDCCRYIVEFRKENQQLQAKVNQLEEKEELHLNRIDELVDRVVKLETNIEEAIKFIDNNMYESYCYVGSEDKLKEILKGDSNE